MSDMEKETNAAEDPHEKRLLLPSSKLGSTSTLKGEWKCDEDVIIQGHLQGKIDSGDHDIHIEKEAKVEAEIQGKNITIFGKVIGNVTASGKILVGKEARLTGDLSAPQIAIQEGAKFKGSVKMLPSG